MLIAFLLCERDILQKPVLYLSHFFKKHRQQYYRALQDVRDYGDWEGWLKFFLTGVAEVSNEATDTSRRIVSLRETHTRLIAEEFGRVAGKGIKILEDLFSRPIITVSRVQDITGLSFPAANNLIARFTEQKILFEMTGKTKNRLFRYTPYISLFD